MLLPSAPGSDERLLQAIRDAGCKGKVITLQPPRAIYHGEQVQGFTWFHALEPHLIEPTSFGDSLWHLERFVLDLLQDQATPNELILIGEGEGASLVMAAIPYLHDRIAGAIVIDGSLPNASWWVPPRVDFSDLPVWLISNARNDEPDTHQLLSQGLAQWLHALPVRRMT
jgi:predicted esterase